MSKKPTIFLESHHLKNPFFGFGQFNYHLINAIHKQTPDSFNIEIHAKDIAKWKKAFGKSFTYKKYYGFRRYPLSRIRRKYDVWHAMNQNTRVEPHSNIPYLLTVHNITYIKNKKTYMDEEVHQRFQEKLKRSTAITYISEYAKSSTHQFFDVPDVPEYVIYNGNPITEIEIPNSYKPERFTERPFLFSIGEFTQRKNFISLINMLPNCPDMDLIIAGKNSTKEADRIRERIKELKLEHRVFLPGKISDLDKQWYFKNCEAFVFPSLREGFGLPIIEAMRFGKPVITSNNTSLPEIGSDIAFYWENYNPQEMASLLNSAIRQFNSHKENYIQRSVDRAQSFSWDTAAKQYIEVYKKLINQSHGS